jgi:ubiquitin carboxyl-terminal hydrolase 7
MGILPDEANYEYSAAHHRFTAEERDWGFTRFAELRKLFSTAWD